MDTAATTASGENSGAVMVFHCTLLNGKFSLRQCQVNWEIANKKTDERKLAPNIKGQASRSGAYHCIDCPRGRYHYEEGKFESGLRITVLKPVSAPPYVPPARAVGGVEKVEPPKLIKAEDLLRHRVPLEELYTLPDEPRETTLPPPDDEAGRPRDTELPPPPLSPRTDPPEENSELESVVEQKPRIEYETRAPAVMPPIQNDKKTSRDFEELGPELELLRSEAVRLLTRDQRNVRAWGAGTRTDYTRETKKAVERLFRALNGNSRRTAQHVGVPEVQIRRWFGGRPKTHLYKIVEAPSPATPEFLSAIGYLEKDKLQQGSHHVSLSDATVYWVCEYIAKSSVTMASRYLGIPHGYLEKLYTNKDLYDPHPPHSAPKPEPESTPEPEPEVILAPEPEPVKEEPMPQVPAARALDLPKMSFDPPPGIPVKRMSFPLREDFDVEILLPRDITNAEVARLSTFLSTIVIPK